MDITIFLPIICGNIVIFQVHLAVGMLLYIKHPQFWGILPHFKSVSCGDNAIYMTILLLEYCHIFYRSVMETLPCSRHPQLCTVYRIIVGYGSSS